MTIGGPSIYPFAGTWLGISREIYPATVLTDWEPVPFDMSNIICDYQRHGDLHGKPAVIVAYGRLKDMKIITRTLCAHCYIFITKAGTVGEPITGHTEPFRWDECEVREL